MNNWALPCQQKMFSFSLSVLFVRDEFTRVIFALPINWNLWNIPLFQSPKPKTAKACQAESMTKLFETISSTKIQKPVFQIFWGAGWWWYKKWCSTQTKILIYCRCNKANRYMYLLQSNDFQNTLSHVHILIKFKEILSFPWMNTLIL